MHAFTFQIAGISFRTESDLLLPYSQKDSFKQFEFDDDEPDVCCHLQEVDSESLTSSPLCKSEVERFSHCVRLSRDGLCSPVLRSPAVRSRLNACLHRPNWVALELRYSSVVIHDFFRHELHSFYASDLKQFLSRSRRGPCLFAPFLTTFSAAMVHCAGLIRHNAAALFLASDEGGKTTVATHSPGGTILCDDQVVLRREGDVFMAHGTPWGRITSSFQQARVGAFFLLEQAEHFELISAKPSSALEYLWNEHWAYRFFLPRHLRVKLFRLLSDACHQSPVYTMRFAKDDIDWDAIDGVMNQSR